MQGKVKQWLLKNQRDTINYQHSRKATEEIDQFVYLGGLVTIGDNSEKDFQVGITNIWETKQGMEKHGNNKENQYKNI